MSSSKRRLVFLTVNSSFSHSSLALPLLHSACSDLTGWEWHRCDITTAQDSLNAVREIYALQCDLLVTTLYLFNRPKALEILQRYHTLAPECRIAAGGPECLGTGAQDLLDEYPWLDCVFRGEGEEMFRYYLENFDTFDRTKNRILPPEGNGVYKEWTSSPCPVNDPFFVTDKPFVQLETSRGCPMHCFYCTSGNTAVRYRTLSQVREELSLLSAQGVKELRILDRTFNVPQERGAALLKLFRKEFPQMRFHLELHPQFLNDALREELRQALPGQLHIEAGVQCFDQEVQKLSGRRSCVEALKEGVEFLCSIPAFETHTDLIAGLPGQTFEHILKDTGTLLKLNAAEIQLEVLKVLPGTPMREVALRHGLRYNPAAPYDVMMSDTISLKEMQQVRDLSRLLDLTCNHKDLHSTVVLMNEELPDFVTRILSFFHDAKGDSTTLWDLKKRFLFLLNICRKENLERSQRELACHWLMAGFPPGQGPDEYSEKCQSPPAQARLTAGTASCLGLPETRFWHLPLQNRSCYFAYNRSFALHLPAAVWLTED